MPAFNYLGPAERVLTVESSVDRVPGCVRLACVSDTHLMEQQVAVPAGDVLVHCGDVLMRSGSVARDEAAAQFAAFAGWLRAQPHKDIVLIGGNHDAHLLQAGAAAVRGCLPDRAVYLENQFETVQGIRFFGSPHSVGTSRNSAWQTPDPRGMWDSLAAGQADVVVSHGVFFAKGHNKWCVEPTLVGKIKASGARLHLCGHLHWCYGLSRCVVDAAVLPSVCCSILDGQYNPTNLPVVVDFPKAVVCPPGADGLLLPAGRRKNRLLLVSEQDEAARDPRLASFVSRQLLDFFEVQKLAVAAQRRDSDVAAIQEAIQAAGDALFAVAVFGHSTTAVSVSRIAARYPRVLVAWCSCEDPGAPSAATYVPVHLYTDVRGADDVASFLLCADQHGAAHVYSMKSRIHFVSRHTRVRRQQYPG
ncbi:Ser/Thr protein phosphatase family protein [Diplonema papillatum]|nr:Ser/Thr protein phosphatase family protein [Diplonema papillatum]